MTKERRCDCIVCQLEGGVKYRIVLKVPKGANKFIFSHTSI